MNAKKNETSNNESDNYKAVTKELMVIPGVGKKIADDLCNLGIRSISDLKNRDPEKLYQQLCDFQGMHVDRWRLIRAYIFINIKITRMYETHAQKIQKGLQIQCCGRHC
ncbi:helix-hairpin-helix domain-containing protein [uncultured Methanolobus sp.]|uniref:helix-hairpin-helix domain-containing protein n=1 Tax=uncultured Methanolobus sp. TaxID=218300 RepID=UPI002AAB8D1C|nr:helix-hairpin-helix domain-containing protein [uncultured Methanolobus sp.]